MNQEKLRQLLFVFQHKIIYNIYELPKKISDKEYDRDIAPKQI